VETHRRSVVKAATYRPFAAPLVFAIAFRFTGRFGSSLDIGPSAAVAKTTLYYLWERLWSGIEWGVEDR
jgi:uncharacterized membrane protein